MNPTLLMVHKFWSRDTNFCRNTWSTPSRARVLRPNRAVRVITLASFLGLGACSGTRPDQTTLPVLKDTVNLRYPMTAQKLGHEGTVRLKLFVSEYGTVERVRLWKSSGHADLDDAAQSYATGLVFHPATVNGTPRPAYVPWRIRFQIADVSRAGVTYVNKILERYEHLSRASGGDREDALQGVLSLHEQFAASTTDALTLNEYIRQVVRSETDYRYKDFWADCPLRFTIFDDFMGRFPEMAQDAATRSLLSRFAAEDITYARTLCFSQEQQTRRDQYVRKLIEVVHDYYPWVKTTPES